MNKREKKLMTILAGAVFVIANLYGWFELMNRENRAKQKTITLKSSIRKSEMLKTQIPQAENYQEYINQWLKRYASDNDRDEYLGGFVNKASSDCGLKLNKGAPSPTEGLSEDATSDSNEPAAKFIKTGYTGEVVGDWKKVIEFAHLLEDTTEFRWLKSADFKTRKSETQDGTSELAMTFTVQKWWHPESQILLAEAVAASGAAATSNTPTEAGATPANTEQAPAPAVVTHQTVPPTPEPDAAVPPTGASPAMAPEGGGNSTAPQ